MELHKAPLIWALAGIVAGIIIGFHFDIWATGLIGVLLTLLVVFKTTRYYSLIVLIMGFVLGWGAIQHHIRYVPKLTEAQIFSVDRIVSRNDGNVNVMLDQLVEEDGSFHSGAKVWARLPENTHQLGPGEIIRLSARIEPIQFTTKDNGFAYYLFANGVDYQLKDWRPKFQPTGQSLPLNHWSGYKPRLISTIQRGCFDREVKGLLVALLTGDKSMLSAITRKQFVDAGAAHVLAVSGMHTGLVYLLILGLFRVFGKGDWSSWMALLVMWGFVLLAACPVSAVRAGLMLTLVVLGQVIGHRKGGLSGWALAAIIQLIWSPQVLFSLGFQLSYLAVLAIILFYPTLSRKLAVKWRPMNWLIQLTVLSFVAQLGVLPLVWYHFGQFPNYFLLTNVALSVMVPAFMMLGSIWSALSMVFPGFNWLDQWVQWLGGALLDATASITTWPNGLSILPAIGALQCAVLAVGLLLLGLGWKHRQVLTWSLGALLIIGPVLYLDIYN